MVLMRHLTTLHLTGELSMEQNNWFRTPKLMEELYDLENDPFETHNLYDDANFSKVRSKLYKKLINQMMENIDKSPAPKRLA